MQEGTTRRSPAAPRAPSRDENCWPEAAIPYTDLPPALLPFGVDISAEKKFNNHYMSNPSDGTSVAP